jgi:hypothetical protein
MLEDPTQIWILGAIATTFAGVVWHQTASRPAFFAMIGCIAFTLLGTLVEYLWVTPREEVDLTLRDIMQSAEANDVRGVVGFLAPSATDTKKLAEDLMPRLDIKQARIISSVEISLDRESDPTAATAKFRGRFQALDKSRGIQGTKPLPIEVNLIRDGERWLVESFTSPEDIRSQAARLR